MGLVFFVPAVITPQKCCAALTKLLLKNLDLITCIAVMMYLLRCLDKFLNTEPSPPRPLPFIHMGPKYEDLSPILLMLDVHIDIYHLHSLTSLNPEKSFISIALVRFFLTLLKA